MHCKIQQLYSSFNDKIINTTDKNFNIFYQQIDKNLEKTRKISIKTEYCRLLFTTIQTSIRICKKRK